MAYDQAVAIILIGTVYLMFKFSDSIDLDQEWGQPLKLLVNMVAMFILLAGVGWAVQLQRLDVTIDDSLPEITVAVFIALAFVILPIVLFMLIMFLKHILEFWDNLRAGEEF